MTSPNGGNDNETDGAEQLPTCRRDVNNPCHDFQATIAGEESVDVWRQGCAIFQGNICRRILLYGLNRPGGLEPFMEEFAFEVAKKVAAIQDNKVKLPQKKKTLNEAGANPEAERIKKQNTIFGLLCNSLLRRWKRSGITAETAIVSLSEMHGRPKSEIKLLIKYARHKRWKRIERMRAYLVPKWEQQGLSAIQVGKRLNVTRQYAKRLMHELHWQAKEAT